MEDRALRAAARLARARSNPETWCQIIAFYEGLISERSWDCLTPLLWLVKQIAPTERARSFRAGQSLWRLIISTAARHGLAPGEPFVLVTLEPEVSFGRRRSDEAPRFRIAYHNPTGACPDVRRCGREEVLSTLDLVLERLRSDSRIQLQGGPPRHVVKRPCS